MNKFVQNQKLNKPSIIEVHNRPIYISQLKELNTNLVLYFHNDPISMDGSRSVKERVLLLEACKNNIQQ